MVAKTNGLVPRELSERLIVDPDIEAMSLDQLQQWIMGIRAKARQGMSELAADGDDHCWHGTVETVKDLVTEEERINFKYGCFGMSRQRILAGCRKFIDFEQENGRVAPDEPSSIE